MNDESEDTGHLILSLTEAMEESRRIRDEIKSGTLGAPDEATPVVDTGTESIPSKG